MDRATKHSGAPDIREAAVPMDGRRTSRPGSTVAVTAIAVALGVILILA